MGIRSIHAYALALGLIGACTDGGLERDPEVLAPREVLARVLQQQLPPTAGPEPLADGPSVWVTLTEITVESPDGGLTRHIPAVPLARGEPLIYPLHDAVIPMVKDPAKPPAINVWVDERVTMPLLLSVLATLARTGADEFRLVGGTPAQPGAVAVEPSPFCGAYEPARPPIADIRTDLALRWGPDGPRAWALPRPAGREPFKVGFYSLEGAPGLTFPSEVALMLEPGDPALDVAAVQRLADSLCTFNDGPFGVELAPLDSTTQRELLAVLVALDSSPRCRGPRRIDGSAGASRGQAITLEALRAHVLALANPSPDSQESPVHDTPP